MFLAQPAQAQRLPQGESILDVQTFRPGFLPNDFLNTRGSRVGKHLAISLALHAIYQHTPLLARTAPDQSAVGIVRNDFALQIAAGMSFWDRLMVGVSLPVSVVQRCAYNDAGDGCRDFSAGRIGEENFSGGGLGDIRLHVKGNIIGAKRPRGFGLGAGAIVTFPTADGAVFSGESSVDDPRAAAPDDAFSPTATFYVAADYTLAKLRFGANVGYLVRRDVKWLNLTAGDQLIYSVAAGYRVMKTVEALLEFNGRFTLTDTDVDNAPHEVLLACRLMPVDGLRIDVGGGVGVIGKLARPDFRLFAGVAFSGRIGAADSDGDGIPDNKDKCPKEREDKDGFKDDDGCPDLDNDEDGIPDKLDKCPNQAAATADGCPSGDSDGDGIPDDRDRCPKQPEDKDGFEDQDGCPDPDNDKDGIPDSKDKCPNKPETPNGYKDDDGCPDKAPKVTPPTVTPTRINIPQRITFVVGKAKLTKAAERILDGVAKTITKNSQLQLIRIEGHTDSRGSKKLNQRLSQRRAQSVRRYLIGRGIAANRLQAVGYGSTRPVASNDTVEGRAKNRRVEFIIIKRVKKKKKGTP